MHRAQCAGVAPHVTVSTSHRGPGNLTVDGWPLGSDAGLLRVGYRALAVSNSCRPPPGSPCLISMAVLAPGDWTLAHAGTRVSQRPDQPTLVIVDQTDPFDFRGHSSGSATILFTRHPRLMLPRDTVGRGVRQLRADLPLYPLALNHLHHLGEIATRAGDVLPDVAASTMSLMSSLLLCAADTSPSAGVTSTLVPAIEHYIHEHLYDPDLSADSIAAAHHISARHLYKIWSGTNGSLAGYIIDRRLEHARRALLTNPDLSISALARQHGFTRPTHFSHRFRSTYGVSPSQWRRHRSPDASPPTSLSVER